MHSVVVIGISSDLPPYDFAKKIDTLLNGVDEFEIVAVNDKKKILQVFADERNKKITFSTSSARGGFKQVISKATHLIIFWSGYDLSELIFFSSLKKIPIKIVPISVTTVVNKDSGHPFDMYIGRGTPWGNPFAIDYESNVGREEVIERYRAYFYDEIVTDPDRRRQLEGLRGLRLGCHCKPLACHGDIIASYLNSHDELDRPAD